jgi:peroxiredoxin
VVFLGVNIKEDKPAAARFERQHRTPYPSIFDQSGSVLARFRSLAPQETPSTVLLDREGRIARVLPGAIDVPVLLPLVRRLVEQEPQS